MKKLKPITLYHGKSVKKRPSIFQQNMLLKALPHTDDLGDLKKIAKFHTEAEVLRTLDKLSIRKEFHTALERNGLGLDSITKALSQICFSAEKEETRLRGLQTVLKAVGLEKYETDDGGGKNWEETLLKIHEQEEQKKLVEGEAPEAVEGELYEVEVPQIPQEALDRRKAESDISDSIYE